MIAGHVAENNRPMIMVAADVDKFRFRIDRYRAMHLLSGPIWRVTDTEVKKKGKIIFVQDKKHC